MIPFFDSAIAPPVSSNIQHYLAQATLPKLRLAPCTPRLPASNHKTHRNNLAIRPERYRKLRHMRRIKRDYLDLQCLDFIKKHIPHTPVQVVDADPDDYEQPSIPCTGFNVEGFLPAPVRHIDGLGVMWLEGSILRTVQAILNMIPEYRGLTKSHSFTCNDIMREEDRQIFRYFMWERSGELHTTSNPDEPPVKLILAYQPPWILGSRDMELFTDNKLSYLPSYDTFLGSGQHRYNSTHKLWAKMWDVCKMHDCRSFVLTNYNQWVFGGFSEGWENGYSSGVKEAITNSDPKGKKPLPRTPSILEYLVYWAVSSIRLPDSCEIPLVSDEVVIETAVNDSIGGSRPVSPFTMNQPIFQQIEPSGSDLFSVTSVPASARVRIGSESDSGETSSPPFLTDTWRIPMDSAMAQQNAATVNDWLVNVDPTSPGPIPAIPRAPSPVRSEWSDRSLATRKPRRHQGFYSLDTTIVEEVFEFNFTALDLT